MDKYNVVVKFLGKTYCAKGVEAKNEIEAQKKALGTFSVVEVKRAKGFPSYDENNPMAAFKDVLDHLKKQ